MKPRPLPTVWQTFTRTVPVWMAWIFNVVLPRIPIGLHVDLVPHPP